MSTANIFAILASLSCAIAFSFVLTPLTYKFAFLIGAVDIPTDERRMHTVPTPRIGGLAIFFGFLLSILMYSIISATAFLTVPMLGMLVGSAIIVILGAFDDALDLNAKFKLVVQIIAASIVVLFGVRLDVFSILNLQPDGLLNDILSVAFTIIWIVGITNAVNFIDGIDGLAAGISTISSISVFIIVLITNNFPIAIIAAALTGACLGFLPFNMNPAKMFMGDCGATFLGFVLAVISIQGLFKSYLLVSFAVPFLILALPIFDTISAIFRRISKGKSPMSADREHLHHKLIDLGFSQKQVVAIIYTCSGIFSLIAIMLTGATLTRALLLSGCTFCIIVISILLLKPRSKKNSKENKDE